MIINSRDIKISRDFCSLTPNTYYVQLWYVRLSLGMCASNALRHPDEGKTDNVSA